MAPRSKTPNSKDKSTRQVGDAPASGTLANHSAEDSTKQDQVVKVKPAAALAAKTEARRRENLYTVIKFYFIGFAALLSLI